MKNLKISMNLLLPHIFILSLLVLGISISLVSLTNIRKYTDALYDGPFVIKSAAGTVNETLEAMQSSVYRAISNGSQDITDDAISEARNHMVILQEQVAQLKRYTLGDIGAFSRFESNLSELAPMHENVLVLATQNNNAEALAYMENTNVPMINDAQKELAQYVRSAEAKERELVASLQQTQKKTLLFLIALGVIGVVFAVRDGTYFWRLHKNLRQRNEQYQSAQMK